MTTYGLLQSASLREPIDHLIGRRLEVREQLCDELFPTHWMSHFVSYYGHFLSHSSVGLHSNS